MRLVNHILTRESTQVELVVEENEAMENISTYTSMHAHKNVKYDVPILYKKSSTI